MCSAMATQASLALAMEIHFIIVSTVCVSPGSRNTWLPPMLAACSDTVIFSSRVILFSARASKISIRVIILVMLAGRSFVSASFSYITVPVEASIRIADGALTAGVSQCAGRVILHAMTVKSIRKQVNFEIILGNI